jgi:outer membrane protein OmpA-like peptidoglycan-associated protein
MAQGGVIRERLLVTGLGESRPIADNGTDYGRAQNRRVEIYISAFTG